MAQYLQRRPGLSKGILGSAHHEFIKHHIPSKEKYLEMREFLNLCTYLEEYEFSEPYMSPRRLVFSEYEGGSHATVQEKLSEITLEKLNKILNDLYSKDPQMYVIFKKQMIGDYVEYSTSDVYNQHKLQWIAKIFEWIKEYNF